MGNICRDDVELLQVAAQLNFIQRAFELAHLLFPSFGQFSILLRQSPQPVQFGIELFARGFALPGVLKVSEAGFGGSRGSTELVRVVTIEELLQ